MRHDGRRQAENPLITLSSFARPPLTATHVIAHLEAFRANTVDARSAYVAISRARASAAVYTDSRSALTDALGIRDGAQLGAIDGHGTGLGLG